MYLFQALLHLFVDTGPDSDHEHILRPHHDVGFVGLTYSEAEPGKQINHHIPVRHDRKTAARSIPLTLLGLLQYIAPTCQFLLGVLLYKEPFTTVHMVGFGLIWTALLIYTLEGFFAGRRKVPTQAAY